METLLVSYPENIEEENDYFLSKKNIILNNNYDKNLTYESMGVRNFVDLRRVEILYKINKLEGVILKSSSLEVFVREFDNSKNQMPGTIWRFRDKKEITFKNFNLSLNMVYIFIFFFLNLIKLI